MYLVPALSPAIALALLTACAGRPTVLEPTVNDVGVVAAPSILDVVTFNVAGLPGFVAKVDGRETHPQIGPALAPFDLALLQEDFWYHDLIEAPHRWQVRPRRGGLLRLGDGLARFSHLPLDEVEHVPWKEAHGLFGHMHDRWAWKGFAAGRLHVGGGRTIWVYNVHFDAGGHAGDRAAKAAQREQLRADIEERTAPGDALIVAGDFNQGPTVLEEFRAAVGLTDCGVGGIDRVYVRSGDDVELTIDPESDRPEPDMEPLRGLSDHGAVWVRLGLGR